MTTSKTLVLVNAESARIVVEQIRYEIYQHLDIGRTASATTTTSLQGTENVRKPNASGSGEKTQRPANSPADEPFGRYMQTMGFDPNDGCVLYLPEKLRWKSKPKAIPQYVDFVAFTDDLLLVRIAPETR